MNISEEERKVLYSYALSMYGKLNADKNVNQSTKDFWWTLSEKLRKMENTLDKLVDQITDKNRHGEI